tara:strand:- start:628 stop:954 length:327 start_codon:yes stop_codon:yes gene_type:complete
MDQTTEITVMAHKKGQGSTKNGRDSNPQYRGVKLYGGESAKPGAIIIRQCGTKFKPGFGVRIGKDDTLYSVSTGKVVFQKNGRVHVDPFEEDIARPQWLRDYRAARAG